MTTQKIDPSSGNWKRETQNRLKNDIALWMQGLFVGPVLTRDLQSMLALANPDYERLSTLEFEDFLYRYGSTKAVWLAGADGMLRSQMVFFPKASWTLSRDPVESADDYAVRSVKEIGARVSRLIENRRPATEAGRD